MSNNKEKECKKLWSEFNDLLGGVLNLWAYGGSGVYTVLEKLKENECKQMGMGEALDKASLDDWGKQLKTLKGRKKKLENLEKLQNELSSAQQSGASNVAMASSLGPAAGIGAGLSLFPLLSRVTKFFK